MFAGTDSHQSVVRLIGPMPVLASAVENATGVGELPSGTVSGYVTGDVFEVGSVHVEPVWHAAAGAVAEVPDELEPLMTRPLVGRSHGAVDVQYAVPVFVKSVDAAVRFQPSPDPVSSTAVIVSGIPIAWFVGPSVADQEAVPGASSPSVPAATVAVALWVQVPFDVEAEHVVMAALAVAVITPSTESGSAKAAAVNSTVRIRLIFISGAPQ